MDCTPRTLADLGFPQLLDALARRCRTAMGRARAAVRPLLDSPEQVHESQSRIAEARQLRQEGYRLPLDSVTDVDDAVARAAKGALLEPRELIAVAQTLFAMDRAREGLALRQSAVPGLAVWGRELPALELLAVRLDRAFEASGEISDRASPALQEARDRARALHRTIKGKLETLLRDEAFVPMLRENYYSLRNDRYVVPVLASSRHEVPGIVHNASQSGQTLFVEPQALLGLGNDLAIAQSLVLEEERRVLQGLSETVGREATRIQAGLGAVALLDEAEAAALLADALDAHPPQVEDAGGPLELRALRHPFLVLQEREVVANDVALVDAVKALVISGPNAGGKTVTLTAVGLAALMLHAGLPIPAAPGSRLPLFRSIHSAIGDAQSLAEGLSTFSAHLAELREIQASAAAGALVLIDEIAADTDPQEGAALAAALLEDLLDRRAAVIVTTHLEELKALAHVDARFSNARVGLDPRKLTPTYRLQIGVAGGSSAIALAERMGLSAQVCERARERLRGQGGALAQAFRSMDEERGRLAQEAEALAAARATAAGEAEALAADRRRFEAEVDTQKEALRAQLRRALAEVDEKVTALRKETSLAQAEALQRAFREQARTLDDAAVTRKASATGPAPAELRPGTWVHHLGLERDVEVVQVEGETITVAAGPLKLRVTRDALGGAQSAKPRRGFPDGGNAPANALQRAKAVAPGTVDAGGARCDVRGLRGEDAVREVDAFLDRAIRGGEASALVVHGHGTGALKAMLREHLGQSPYVAAFRPGESHEGGDGVTCITLRG